MNMIEELLKDKRILITGACGTIGKALVECILRYKPEELRVMDNNESELFLLSEYYKDNPNFIPYLGDIRDREKMLKLLRGIDVVFHTAAFKHVILSEYNPFDVVQTNVLGVENIIWASLNNKVRLVVNTSSDKAVNPTNVMGSTKLLGEKLFTAANAARYGKETIFVSTRFGNVMGSRGSVVPLFAKQIHDGGPVTLTDPRMTRFVMTIDDAVDLILLSAVLARGGEVFVTKMPVVRIKDLAEVMIELLAPEFGYNPDSIKIVTTGAKPGEKLHEELMSYEETRRTLELKEVFVILPAFKSIYKSIEYSYPDVVNSVIDKPYVSSIELPLAKDKLKSYLLQKGIIKKILEERLFLRQ